MHLSFLNEEQNNLLELLGSSDKSNKKIAALQFENYFDLSFHQAEKNKVRFKIDCESSLESRKPNVGCELLWEYSNIRETNLSNKQTLNNFSIHLKNFSHGIVNNMPFIKDISVVFKYCVLKKNENSFHIAFGRYSHFNMNWYLQYPKGLYCLTPKN